MFKPRIMSPLNRGSYLFVRFPGVPPLGYHISPLAGALISAGIRPHEGCLRHMKALPLRAHIIPPLSLLCRLNLTAAQPQSHFAPARGEIKNIVARGQNAPPEFDSPRMGAK